MEVPLHSFLPLALNGVSSQLTGWLIRMTWRTKKPLTLTGIEPRFLNHPAHVFITMKELTQLPDVTNTVREVSLNNRQFHSPLHARSCNPLCCSTAVSKRTCSSVAAPSTDWNRQHSGEIISNTAYSNAHYGQTDTALNTHRGNASSLQLLQTIIHCFFLQPATERPVSGTGKVLKARPLASVIAHGHEEVVWIHVALLCVEWSRTTLQYSSVQYTSVQFSAVLVHYSAVQYATVQCSTLHYSSVQYSTVLYTTLQCSTLQFSAVHYSTVQSSILEYSAEHYSIVQYTTVQCSILEYSAKHYSIVQYTTVQCSTTQCSTLQYSAVHYSTVHCSTIQYSKVQNTILQFSTLQYSSLQYNTVQNTTVQYSA
jgi:hypothetical protein